MRFRHDSGDLVLRYLETLNRADSFNQSVDRPRRYGYRKTGDLVVTRSQHVNLRLFENGPCL